MRETNGRPSAQDGGHAAALRGQAESGADRPRARRILPPDARASGRHPTEPPGPTPAEATNPEAQDGVSVVVADRQRWIAEAIRDVLAEEGFQSRPVATTTDELEAVVAMWAPDVVLVDLALPVSGALEVGQRLREASPELHVAALSAGDDDTANRAARRAGLAGCLSKQMSPTQLVRAVRGLLAGQRVRTAGVTGRREHHRIPRLTSRELEILRLLSEGAGGRRIAATLGISQHTVRTHVQNVLAKLNVNSRIEAVAYAVSWGLLPPQDLYQTWPYGSDVTVRTGRDTA